MKHIIVTLVGLFLLAGCATSAPTATPVPPTATASPTPAPDSVAIKLAEAVNAQDLEGALALFSEDAVVNSGEPAPYTGQAEIQGWLEGMFADNFEIEAEILEVKGDTVLEGDVIRMDSARDLGVDSLQGSSEITVQGGKITAINFTFSQESLAELQAARLKATVPTFADVPYHDDGDPMHVLDVYLPGEVEGPRPVLFAIHGDNGSKDDFDEMAGYFLGHGYAAVLPQIRHKGERDHPFMLQDAFCSLAWVHANADTYGFDTQRIVVFGYSLGGLLSASLGAVDDPSQFLAGCPYSLPASDWVQGVATYAAVLMTPDVCLAQGWCMVGFAADSEFSLGEARDIFTELNKVPPSTWRENSELSEDAKKVAQTAPLYWVDGSEPPFLLMHGEADEYVPTDESQGFASQFRAMGGEVELLLFPGAGHNPNLIKVCEVVQAFASGLWAERR